MMTSFVYLVCQTDKLLSSLVHKYQLLLYKVINYIIPLSHTTNNIYYFFTLALIHIVLYFYITIFIYITMYNDSIFIMHSIICYNHATFLLHNYLNDVLYIVDPLLYFNYYLLYQWCLFQNVYKKQCNYIISRAVQIPIMSISVYISCKFRNMAIFFLTHKITTNDNYIPTMCGCFTNTSYCVSTVVLQYYTND